MNTYGRRWWASGLAGVAVIAAPAVVCAQVTPSPDANRTVAVVPFTGGATADLMGDIEAAVRGSLLARGARVPPRDAVLVGLGVTPPHDALGYAHMGQSMSATHVLVGTVTPLAGQYNLTLTLYEASSGRSAQQARNIGEGDTGPLVNEMLTALFEPSALGPAPVDPDAQRRADEERRRQEAQAQADAQRRAEEEARRRADEERQRREREERDHPVRRYDQAGPIALGASLTVGGRLSGTSTPSAMALHGQVPAASGVASLLRIEAAYALSAVRGLELTAAFMVMMSPTNAIGLGAGAQYTVPSSGRFPLRGTFGATVGLFQGVSGARATTVWLSPFARAEYGITPAVNVFAGVSLDVAPAGTGGVTTLGFTAGLRVRFGN